MVDCRAARLPESRRHVDLNTVDLRVRERPRRSRCNRSPVSRTAHPPASVRSEPSASKSRAPVDVAEAEAADGDERASETSPRVRQRPFQFRRTRRRTSPAGNSPVTL